MNTETKSIIIFSFVTAMGLTILAAATFAFSSRVPAEQQVYDNLKLTTTTIEKNQTWPVIGKEPSHPCAVSLCQDV